jgi:hypothetical protein
MAFSIYLFSPLSLLSVLLLIINITKNKGNINSSICTDINNVSNGAVTLATTVATTTSIELP